MADSTSGIGFSRIAVVTGFPATLIPVAAAIASIWFTARISEVWQFTSAYVHGLAVFTFALFLFASMMVNASLACRRWKYRPTGLVRWARYPLWQSVVIVASLVWFLTAVLNPASVLWTEQASAATAAIASVMSFFWVIRSDPASVEARNALIRLEELDDPFGAFDLRRE